MFSTIQKAIVLTALIFLTFGAALATATPNSTAPTLTPNPAAAQTEIGRTFQTPAPPESHRLAAINAQNTRVAAVSGYVVIVWGLDSGKVLATYDTGDRTLTDIAFSPEGLSLAASANDGSVLVWAVP